MATRHKHDLLEITKGHCAYCGKDLTLEPEWHQDHVIPKSKGGRWKGNRIPACVTCNTRKGCLTSKQFREWIKLRAIKQHGRLTQEYISRIAPFLRGQDKQRFKELIYAMSSFLDEMEIHFYLEELE